MRFTGNVPPSTLGVTLSTATRGPSPLRGRSPQLRPVLAARLRAAARQHAHLARLQRHRVPGLQAGALRRIERLERRDAAAHGAEHRGSRSGCAPCRVGIGEDQHGSAGEPRVGRIGPQHGKQVRTRPRQQGGAAVQRGQSVARARGVRRDHRRAEIERRILPIASQSSGASRAGSSGCDAANSNPIGISHPVPSAAAIDSERR